MIELIFSIVIMGIVMMSAPMLISSATKSTSVALQQEGINEAVSRVSMILTYEWDEKNTDIPCVPPVLHVLNGDPELDIATNARRVGVPVGSNSRTFKCGNDELNASAIGSGGGDGDDIDDFSNDPSLVPILTGSGGQDYIEQNTVSIATAISYLSDSASYGSAAFAYAPTASAGITNIKAIAVTLTSTSGVSELSKIIRLNAFSCNIGGYEFESREMP